MEKIRGIVTFRLSDLDFCARIDNVITTVKIENLNRAYDLAGVKNLKLVVNKIDVPLINLYRTFDLKIPKSSTSTRIVLYEKDDKTIGFFVDEVRDYINFDRKLLRKIDFYPPEKNSLTEGTLKYEGVKYHLPDFEKIIDTELKRNG